MSPQNARVGWTLTNVVSYCFLSVGTVGAVRCVRTINSVKVFVETYVSCNDAYSCAIPRAIVEVVCKYFKCLRVVNGDCLV